MTILNSGLRAEELHGDTIGVSRCDGPSISNVFHWAMLDASNVHSFQPAADFCLVRASETEVIEPNPGMVEGVTWISGIMLRQPDNKSTRPRKPSALPSWGRTLDGDRFPEE